MAIRYLCCGNIMSDRIEDQNGNYSEWNMGGPAFYALSGMRLWTPEVKLVCKTGEDYAESYGKWMDENHVNRESVRVAMERHTRYTLKYQEDGTFRPTPSYSLEYLGFLKTHAEDIDRAAEGEQIRGIYMANNLDRVVWDDLGSVKEKHGFGIMWEIEYAGIYRKSYGMSRDEVISRVRYALQTADAWSINSTEASDMFDIPRENDSAIINELQKLPAAFTFYRVGSRGSYAVTPTEAYFCPVVKPFGESIDPTGCGNCSTGSAGFAYFEGKHPAMVAAMANVAGGYNAAQRGPWRLYTDDVMKKAKTLAESVFEKMMHI